ncbi:glycoside hydrolase family 78 protein [Cadophora sp. MPI-SDFR-AT-0126]|nr:glycoside hydrolase family 78 protein [Leotiomycetes sp. MPI-SDFR-AT-0126]
MENRWMHAATVKYSPRVGKPPGWLPCRHISGYFLSEEGKNPPLFFTHIYDPKPSPGTVPTLTASIETQLGNSEAADRHYQQMTYFVSFSQTELLCFLPSTTTQKCLPSKWKFTRCGTHGFHETLGIDADKLRFYWTLESHDALALQTAYQVTVIEIPPGGPNSDGGGKVIWDSKKCISPAQRNILCKPTEGFHATTEYHWLVTVWDQEDREFTSESNSFFTAYPRSQLLPPLSMNQTYMPHTALIFRTWFENIEDKWKAWWIGDGGDKPIYLRRSFILEQKPTRAIAFVAGLGHHNFSANGAPASDHVLDPGWTNYHRTVQYVAHDLTSVLHPGENVIGAHIGNGFYAGDQGDRFFWPKYEDNTYVRYGNELCFFAELHLFYPDGTHDIIKSDSDWQVRKSATTLANIYASETHDRRQYPVELDAAGFDASSWKPAKGLTGPRGFLKYQSQPPVTRHETFNSISTTSPRPGVVCYDLGQNASTMVKIVVEGNTGSEITIRYAETAYEDGTVKMPDPLFKEFETGVYSTFILAGTGSSETWEPDFSFTSARYIQLEGVSTEPGHDFLSYIRRLANPSHVNQLLNALKWTFTSNLFSYHTDCPQIEKFGWLEVTHLLAPATQYMVDMEDLYTKILDDILDAQEPNGLVPTMAPEIRYMCGPLHDTITWGCALIFIPDILKKYYGSTHTIPKMYRAGERYMGYMTKKERKGGLIEHGLGDWGRGIAHGNAQANIETAVYHECLCCMERFVVTLGLTDEAAKWKSEASRIYDVYNKHLLVTDDPERPYAYYTSLDNYPTRDRDAVCQAVALQFNMVPLQHKDDVMKAFLDDVADGKLRSGEIGLRYLFNTLHDANRPDLVLQMARQEEHPSYMRFLRRGETTLLEFWQDECRSKCHDMLGSILEWFYVAVLGIKVSEDGYRTFTVAPPYVSEFDAVKGTFECPYGEIAVDFKRGKDGVVVLELTVPLSTTPTVLLPDPSSMAQVTRHADKSSSKTETGASILLRHGKYSVRIT